MKQNTHPLRHIKIDQNVFQSVLVLHHLFSETRFLPQSKIMLWERELPRSRARTRVPYASAAIHQSLSNKTKI